MPTFDIVRHAAPTESFRVKSVMGQYDLQESTTTERFIGEIPLPPTWNIGLIVGRSVRQNDHRTRIVRRLHRVRL